MQESLTNEVCRTVLSKLADLACSDEASLKSIGISEQQIVKLSKLSQRDIYRLTMMNRNVFDVAVIVERLLPEPNVVFPKDWETFLLYGASNEMMKHYYGARSDDCHLCRSQLPTDQILKGRTIPDLQHIEVVKALNIEKDRCRTNAEVLLNIAKTHQVSLCALWNELKKWEIE